MKFPRNTEVQTKDINIDDALSRVRRPLDSTKMTLSVNGVFALPESWKQKIQTVSTLFLIFLLTVTLYLLCYNLKQDDPNESMYTYEVEMCGVRVKNSKIQQRELSEEEKAEAEAKGAKGGKAPPKAKGKEEEPTAEELERVERARLDKEEQDRLA